MKRTAISLFVLIISANISFADEGMVLDLDKIIVTASRFEESYAQASRSVTVIDKRQLEDLNPVGIGEVLEQTPSLDVLDYGHLGALKTIRLRGSTASQTLVMVDGRPANNPRDGEVDLNQIGIDNIDRIEIIRGPASSLYGSSAVGGVVNIITKSGRDCKTAEYITSCGTYYTYINKLKIADAIKNLDYYFTNEYSKSDGNRDNSKSDIYNNTVKFGYLFDTDNKLSLSFGRHQSNVGNIGYETNPDLDDEQRRNMNYIDLNWDADTDWGGGLSAKFYQNFDRLEFVESLTPHNVDAHTVKQRGFDVSLRQIDVGINKIVLGTNWYDNRLSSSNSGKHTYNVKALYLQDELDLLKPLHLTLGARFDDYSNLGTEFNPNANFLVDLPKDVKFYSMLGRSFRAPSFNDLYWPREDWGAWGGVEGNTALSPERCIGGEAGIKGLVTKFLLIDIAYFRNSYKDLIDWRMDSSYWWRPANVGSAVIQGAEAEAKFKFLNMFDGTFSYTYMDAKDEKNDVHLVYRPKNKYNCILGYKNSKGFQLNLEGKYITERYINIDNTDELDDYFVMGADASQQINKHLDVFISVDNLLDRQYQEQRYYPMPGFSVRGGVKVKAW